MTCMCEAVRKYGDERQHQERLETIREALKMNLPIDSIAKLARLPVEEVHKLIYEMEK